jgi:hypothetical protein
MRLFHGRSSCLFSPNPIEQDNYFHDEESEEFENDKEIKIPKEFFETDVTYKRVKLG